MTRILFKNRAEAGKRLAAKVNRLRPENPVVLAVANGGVIVGSRIAETFKCPLVPVIAKKIFFPDEDSLGFGAVNDDGEIFLSRYAEGVPEEIIKYQTGLARKIVKQRRKTFKKFSEVNGLIGKTAVLVDDSLATGSTMMSALSSIKKKNPEKTIIAATLASEQALELLKNEVSEIIVLYRHPAFSHLRLSDVYEDYSRVTNKKALETLSRHAPDH